MDTIRWGIIGCGDVTEIKSGPAFSKVPHSKLVAVMRRQAEKARDYARRHGVARWYDRAQDLVNDPEVNAVYVATPPASHEEYALMAIQAGKPVYVEKPMTVNASSARRMTEAASATGVKLTIAHYRRQQPLFLRIKSLLEEGSIGKPSFARLELYQPHQSTLIAKPETNWRLDPKISGGGLFHDLAPHQLDLLLYFFGRPLQSGGCAFNAAGLYEADDTVQGQIVFENGPVFLGSWCFTAPVKKDYCTITGPGGSIQFSVFAQEPVLLERDGTREQFRFDPLPHVQQPMIAAVVNYFLDRGPNPCPPEEGVNVMELMDSFCRPAVPLIP